MKQKQLIIAVAMIVIVAAVVIIMLNADSKPSTMEVRDGSLVIGGSFGVTVPVSEISGLEWQDALPGIGRKTNGSGVGSVYKGEFTLADGAKARLYADGKKPPFIRFTQGGTVFYLNAGTKEQTEELMAKLEAAIKR